MAIKSTQVVKEQRIKQVMALLVVGKYRWEIVQDLSKEWECSEANVDQYIADAKELMSDHFSKETINDILSKYNYLYNDALRVGDKRQAKNVLDSIAKVAGYYKDKVELSGSIDHNVSVIRLTEIIKDDKDI